MLLPSPIARARRSASSAQVPSAPWTSRPDRGPFITSIAAFPLVPAPIGFLQNHTTMLDDHSNGSPFTSPIMDTRRRASTATSNQEGWNSVQEVSNGTPPFPTHRCHDRGVSSHRYPEPTQP